MIFVLTNVIYIVYDRKNENHWSLLITCYSLLGIQTPEIEQVQINFKSVSLSIITQSRETRGGVDECLFPDHVFARYFPPG